jgi:hypothetical protein
MKIEYFDLYCWICGDIQRDMKEILTIDYQKVFLNDFPLVDDLCDWEMLKIMKMPVIQISITKRMITRFQLEILVCSCFQGRLFLYLFSGKNWKTYYVNFLS